MRGRTQPPPDAFSTAASGRSAACTSGQRIDGHAIHPSSLSVSLLLRASRVQETQPHEPRLAGKVPAAPRRDRAAPAATARSPREADPPLRRPARDTGGRRGRRGQCRSGLRVTGRLEPSWTATHRWVFRGIPAVRALRSLQSNARASTRAEFGSSAGGLRQTVGAEGATAESGAGEYSPLSAAAPRSREAAVGAARIR